jgi:hypothetical protein
VTKKPPKPWDDLPWHRAKAYVPEAPPTDPVNRKNAEFWAKEAARRDKQIKRIDKLADDTRTHKLGRLLREIDGSFDRKQSARGSRPRKKRGNPIIEFIMRRLKRNPKISIKEMLTARFGEAETGSTGLIQVSADNLGFDATGEDGSRFHLAERSLPAVISRLRRKIS